MQYLEIPTVPKLFKILKFEVLTAKRRSSPPPLAMHPLHHLKVGGGREANPTTPCTILRAGNLLSLLKSVHVSVINKYGIEFLMFWKVGGGGEVHAIYNSKTHEIVPFENDG